MKVTKVLFERKHAAGYVYRRETWEHDGMGPTEIVACYTPSGDYIGSARDARRLCCKRGLVKLQKTHSSHCVCSIGFQPTKKRWYGWSHRAIYGYGVGDRPFCGNEKRGKGKKIKTLAEAKRSAVRFAGSVS